jgi:hypothetical protein
MFGLRVKMSVKYQFRHLCVQVQQIDTIDLNSQEFSCTCSLHSLHSCVGSQEGPAGSVGFAGPQANRHPSAPVVKVSSAGLWLRHKATSSSMLLSSCGLLRADACPCPSQNGQLWHSAWSCLDSHQVLAEARRC